MASRRFQFGDDYNFGDVYRTERSPYSSLRFGPDRFDFSDFQDDSDSDALRQNQEDPRFNQILGQYRSILSQPKSALNRYREFSKTVPQYQDYRRGKWGRLGAALVGAGVGFNNPALGPQAAMQFLDRPYEQALERFDIDRQLLGEEAEFEAKERADRIKALDVEMDALNEMMKQAEQRRVNESLIGYRGKQGENIESQIAERQSQAAERERRFNFLRDVQQPWTQQYQGGQLDVARQNALTSRGQLGLGQQRFQFESGPEFQELTRHRKEQERLGEINAGTRFWEMMRGGRSREPVQSYIVPSQEESAQGLVLRELWNDPEFAGVARQVIEYDPDYPNEWNFRDDLDLSDEKVRSFVEMVKEMTTERLNRRRK